MIKCDLSTSKHVLKRLRIELFFVLNKTINLKPLNPYWITTFQKLPIGTNPMIIPHWATAPWMSVRICRLNEPQTEMATRLQFIKLKSTDFHSKAATSNRVICVIPEKLPSMVSVLSPPSKTSRESQFCSVTKLITWIWDEDKRSENNKLSGCNKSVITCVKTEIFNEKLWWGRA